MKKKILLVLLTISLSIASVWAYTAQFHAGIGTVNGYGTSDASISEPGGDGNGVTLPTVTFTCTGWEFAGWVASSAPYEASDELTQELYRPGYVYHLSSVSEEFYAVYRYNTDRYCEIHVNDQLVTGAQYIVVNDVDYDGYVWDYSSFIPRQRHVTLRYPVIYPTESSIAGISIRTAYNTWDDGYININSATQLNDAERSSIIYVLNESNEINHYWSFYNPYTDYYLSFSPLCGIRDYTSAADCSVARADWNKFTFTGVSSGYYIGFYEDPYNYENFHEKFFIFRQQTIFTSTPDCNVSGYTVTLNAGDNGRINGEQIVDLPESSYHTGVVLLSATPYTGGNTCNNLWEFVGWTESSNFLNTGDATSLSKRLWLAGEVYYPKSNETLHAVYRRKSTTWEQVEDLSTLQAGEKVLIAYKNGDNYYVLSSARQSDFYNSSVSVVGSTITSNTNAALVWTLEGKKGAWRLKDNNGKHLDMTRSDYAYSYTYPWSRWSDEFTISGENNLSIRSNYAEKRYLTANGTRFSSSTTANTNIHIYRQVTTYSRKPQCDEYTIWFNSGEGTFGGDKNATVSVEDVSSKTGISLSDSKIPVAIPPQGCGWYFAGWSVGEGVNSTTSAPGVLYTSADTYIPMQDNITLYAVYQKGNGAVYYEKVNRKTDVTGDGTYVIVCNSNNKAVTFNGTNAMWDGTTVDIDNNIITSYVTPSMLWIRNGSKTAKKQYFYNGTNDDTHRLARNGNADYAGVTTNDNSPFTLYYKTGGTNYYLKWDNNAFSYATSSSSFLIFKQKSTVAEYNSWPHCTPFSVDLNACGGSFATGDASVHTLTEASAGDGVIFTASDEPAGCSGWTFEGWVEKKALQATSVDPSTRLINGSYSPKKTPDQLYAVYKKAGENLWSSYPACGEGIEVVEWAKDSIAVESYLSSLVGKTPTLNGKAGKVNPDGTYYFLYDVASNPCVPLLIQWGDISQIVKTPFLVSTYTRTSAVMSAVGDCSDCDMVVLKGGTAVVDGTQTVRGISVYPGGRFNLGAGKSFAADSLIMRTDSDGLAPIAVISGTFNCPKLYHDRRISNYRKYWMALPYDVTISAIDYADATANGKSAEYDTDFYLQFYNGKQRAIDKGTSNTYWMHIGDITDESYQTKTTLKAGRGYLISLPRSKQNSTGHKYRTLRFPMSVVSWTSETGLNKTVAAEGKSCDWPQHIGWNLIGNPFLQNYSAITANDLACGKLTDSIKDGIWVEPWYTLEEGTKDVPYITIYDPSSDSYTQTRVIGQNIAPFSAAFVQLADGVTGLRFNGTAIGKSNAPARRMGLLNEEDNKSDIEIVALGNTEDRFTIIVDDQYSTDYEIGADLLKFNNNGQLNIYAHHNGTKCVFDAINYIDADSIPVGYTQPEAGYMLIKAREAHLTEAVEHVWLIDNETNTWTDLLKGTYEFETEAGTVNDRLWISIRRTPMITTDIENENIGSGVNPSKIIYNGQLYIIHDGKIFNAVGNRVK